MSITLSHPTRSLKGEIHLTSSKSESNRALIIKALCDESFKIDNLSVSNDTKVLRELLNMSLQQENDSADKEQAKISDKVTDNYQQTWSVGMAGTAMRFLTAYLSIQNQEVVLTGAQRMKERPIKVLVDVLRQLGAEISYQEKEGYPPLKIKGKKLVGGKVVIDGSVSSQYISALLMIAPKLENGLTIEFQGEIISKPYINMTIEMMCCFGAEVQWEGNSIVVKEGNYKANNFKVEADWSAASYWYSMVALAKEADVTLYGLKKGSLQGDSAVQEIYKSLGVETEFVNGGIRLTKVTGYRIQDTELKINFVDFPDIAQTVAVTCAALNIKAKLTGLQTLRIKETDRIVALQTELTKLCFSVEVDGDDVLINFIKSIPSKFNQSVKTYDDHRMAMAFAPLSLLGEITIDDKSIVAKSYPNFWKDLEAVDFV
jgi:3-phosphoshikimate 1-carboxyvinyltransferase